MIITGTCYFPRFENAVNYYYAYYGSKKDTEQAVSDKIKNNHIFIGEPPIKDKQKIFVKENRYFIQE